MKPLILVFFLLALVCPACSDEPQNIPHQDKGSQMGESINSIKKKAMDASESSQRHMDETMEAGSE